GLYTTGSAVLRWGVGAEEPGVRRGIGYSRWWRRQGGSSRGDGRQDEGGQGTTRFHESPLNQFTNQAFNPTSKIPEFEVCAVRVEKVE
ncbi:MAG: hypothetical protein WBC82_09170, partial [Dehalococcoidia bacterium]